MLSQQSKDSNTNQLRLPPTQKNPYVLMIALQPSHLNSRESTSHPKAKALGNNFLLQ